MVWHLEVLSDDGPIVPPLVPACRARDCRTRAGLGRRAASAPVPAHAARAGRRRRILVPPAAHVSDEPPSGGRRAGSCDATPRAAVGAAAPAGALQRSLGADRAGADLRAGRPPVR